jgi:heterotetrameric sarcosine oxidase delta subunit
MLRIPCPHCGVRDEPEFSFGGPAHVARPDLRCGDREWTDYLFNRDNPKGVHLERWCHTFGCRQWFNIARDTVTHQIAACTLGSVRPTLPDKCLE